MPAPQSRPATAPEPHWPSALTRRGLRRNSPLVSFAVLGLADALAWVTAWLLAAGIADDPSTAGGPLLVGTAIIVQLVAGISTGMYSHRHPIGSSGELPPIGTSAAAVLIALVVASVATGGRALEEEPVLAWLLALVLIVALRQAVRMLVAREKRPQRAAPVVIVGAGEVGPSLVEQMLRDPASPYLPIALLDDDRNKRGFRVHGVGVQGTTNDLGAVLERTGAEGAVVAIANASPALFARLSDQAAAHGAWLRTVPSISELIGEDVPLSSIREIDVADLIGRAVSRPDPAAVRSLVAGRRILVTGAGGSIGSELSRQISGLSPASLVMLDRDESALHALSMSMHGSALLDSDEFVLGDIRDRAALDAIFEVHRPQVVFHAAALKHLPVLERFPAEAWKTNVHGTANVIAAAEAIDVEHFVNISTDKAARPYSVLGRSKRIAESVTTAAADRTGRTYVSVRFGNVIGSRGSAIPAFAEQIRSGGPVTLTHPETTRYFMTIPEACELVLFAVAVGRPGETLVLDMGEPVRIADIIERMMVLFSHRVPVVHTGLRPGEKLHEELFTPDELEVVRTSERVTHVRNDGIGPGTLPAPDASPEEVDAFYRAALPETGAAHQPPELVSGAGAVVAQTESEEKTR